MKLTLENAKLTPTAKKALCDIVYNAFSDKQTMYDAVAQEKKEQILDQYKKAVGFDKLLIAVEEAKKNLDLANSRYMEAQHKVNMKGLTVYGEQMDVPNYYGNDATKKENVETKKACEKIKRLLDVANNQGLHTQRDKLISSIWCANTTYEAQSLMANVLGSGEPLVDVIKLEHKES
jgi:hypothetical protein